MTVYDAGPLGGIVCQLFMALILCRPFGEITEKEIDFIIFILIAVLC